MACRNRERMSSRSIVYGPAHFAVVSAAFGAAAFTRLYSRCVVDPLGLFANSTCTRQKYDEQRVEGCQLDVFKLNLLAIDAVKAERRRHLKYIHMYAHTYIASDYKA